MKIKTKGFTLIELMISVVVLSILSGVVMSTINPRGVRNKTEDASKRSNLEKLYMGIEAYKAAEGSYPTCNVTEPCTRLEDMSSGLSTYVQAWPTEPAGATYAYRTSNGGKDFTVTVQLSSDTSYVYEYSSQKGYIERKSIS